MRVRPALRHAGKNLLYNGNNFPRSAGALPGELRSADISLHPSWRAFIRYCEELQHGEIEVLKIQDGLPVLAEVVKKKVKFTP